MIKNWQIARAAVIAGGCVYVWALIPTSIRPQIPNNPVRKSQQTVTVNVDQPSETQVPWQANGAIQAACKPPLLLRPFEGNATSVRVLLRYRDVIVRDVKAKCSGVR